MSTGYRWNSSSTPLTFFLARVAYLVALAPLDQYRVTVRHKGEVFKRPAFSG
jgi:hypothetical protein